jgi:small-conductance mechanosensitive channel
VNLEDFLSDTVLGNPVSQWLWAAGIFVGTLVLCWITIRLISKALHRLADKTATVWDDIAAAVVGSTKQPLLVFVAAWAAIQALVVPDWIAHGIHIAAVVALALQVGIWANKTLAEWMAVQRKKKKGEPDTLTWLSGIEWAAKIVIGLIILLIGLENLGVDVTGLATGLGIGGIAVALAVQNILGDLFASFSIYLDKPFVLGDFLAIDAYSGNVEKIGVRTTRIRSITGEQLVFSNNDLLQSRIRNYGRMNERRSTFTIGVTYDTPAEIVEKIPGFIEEVVEAQPNTRFDRSHFKDFGDSSLNVETVYYMLVPDYRSLMDTQQKVNLEVLRRFNAEGVEFAFPTQTLYVEKGSAENEALKNGDTRPNLEGGDT